MKSKIIFIASLIFLNNSCVKCDEDGPTGSFKLTAFEKSLIPFTEYGDLQ